MKTENIKIKTIKKNIYITWNKIINLIKLKKKIKKKFSYSCQGNITTKITKT